MRDWPRLVLLLAVLLPAVVGESAAAQSGPDPVRLVVVLLGGLGTAPDVNTAVSVEDYSYRYPDLTYGRCDTSQPIADSARRLDHQVRDLAERHPAARFLLVGHSLGGVVASRWAADAAPDLLAKTAAVVTLDSPLQGMADVPAEMRDLVAGWVTAQLCSDRRVLDELSAGRADGPLAGLGHAVEALAAAGGRLYTGASRGDIAISWRSATLPGAEVHYFDSGICADWASLAAAAPGLSPDAATTDWARVRAQLAALPPQAQRALLDRLAACLDVSHGNVLRDPAAVGWLADVAQAALAAAAAPTPTATPTPAP